MAFWVRRRANAEAPVHQGGDDILRERVIPRLDARHDVAAQGEDVLDSRSAHLLGLLGQTLGGQALAS